MKNILRFSGMGIQMAVFISLGAYLGHLIDQDANRLSDTKTQWATIFLSLLFTVLSLIWIIYQAQKINK
jgi:membrane protein DedA with SNARE-associated domain|tara:strand:- start:290 stop:496 length:207 start_codon:yes stop_codon:yes gene_type:complete